MFFAITSRNACWRAMPSALIDSGRRNARSGRGSWGNEIGLGMVAHRAAQTLVGGLQQLGVGVEADLGVGERGHVALQIGLLLRRGGLAGLQRLAEVHARAGLER